MAVVGSLMVEMGANIARLQTDLNKGLGQIHSFNRNVESIFKAGAMSIAGYFTFAGVVSGLKSITDAAEENVRAVRELGIVLESQGYQVQILLPIYRGWADQIRETTVYSDEAALAAMKFLTIMGIAPAKIQDATKVSLDLATVMGIDLESAARMVGQAMNGQFRQLGRLIPELKNLKGSALNAANVLALIAKVIGPQAAAEAGSYGGQVKRLKNEFDELEEELGKGLVPMLRDSAIMLRDMIGWIRSFSSEGTLAIKQAELDQIKYLIAVEKAYQAKSGTGQVQARPFTAAFPYYTEKRLKDLEAEKKEIENDIAFFKAKQMAATARAGALLTGPPGGPPGPHAGADSLGKQWAAQVKNWQFEIDNANADPFLVELAKIDKAIEEQRVKFGKMPNFEAMAEQYRGTETGKIISKYANEDLTVQLKISEDYKKLYKDRNENLRKSLDDGIDALNESIAESRKIEEENIAYLKDQQETKMSLLASAVSEADVPGVTTAFAGMKMLQDLELQKEAYAETLNAAWEHYEKMLTSKEEYLDRSYLLDEYYNNLMAMEDEKTNFLRWQSYAGYAQMMKGGMEALGAVMGKNQKEWFIATKAVSIAMILIQGYVAAMAAAAHAATQGGAPAAAAAYTAWMAITWKTAAMAAIVAVGQLATMSSGSSGGGIPGAGATTGTTIPTTAEKVLQRSQVINFYIYGNVYDEKKLARELQPYLTQAQTDGVR